MDTIISYEWLISICIGSIPLILIIGFYQYFSEINPVLRRLNNIKGKQDDFQRKKSSEPDFKKTLKIIIKHIIPQTKDSLSANRIKNELLKAGFRTPEALSVFSGIRIIATLSLPVLSWFISSFLNKDLKTTIIWILIAGFLGFLLPSMILDRMVKKRGENIGKELPDVLDLLVIAVESGLGLDAAVKRVSEEVIQTCPILAEEFSLLSMEISLGSLREKALKNLAKRCFIDEINSLVAMLIQADRFGVSISQSLRVHSDEVRSKRRQKLEEAAAKIPLKLLFPVMFLIFPCIMVVMIGPAVIKLMDNFFK